MLWMSYSIYCITFNIYVVRYRVDFCDKAAFHAVSHWSPICFSLFLPTSLFNFPHSSICKSNSVWFTALRWQHLPLIVTECLCTAAGDHHKTVRITSQLTSSWGNNVWKVNVFLASVWTQEKGQSCRDSSTLLANSPPVPFWQHSLFNVDSFNVMQMEELWWVMTDWLPPVWMTYLSSKSVSCCCGCDRECGGKMQYMP